MYCQSQCFKIIFKRLIILILFIYYFDKDQTIRVNSLYTLLQNKSGKWFLVQPPLPPPPPIILEEGKSPQ